MSQINPVYNLTLYFLKSVLIFYSNLCLQLQLKFCMHFNVEITMKLTSRIIEYICCKQSLAVCTLPGIHCQLGADANNMKFRRDKRREPLGLLDHPPPPLGLVSFCVYARSHATASPSTFYSRPFLSFLLFSS